MKLLDLFCGAGGAAMGYYRAGFDQIVGIDNQPQPRYPFAFVQADALEYVRAHGHDFDLIHASPPCQRYSSATPIHLKPNHPDLIGPTRQALQSTGRPYVIENVSAARYKLKSPVKLCGTMFGLPIRRHRFFEIWPRVLLLTPPCNHPPSTVYISGTYGRTGQPRRRASTERKRAAIGIDWMTHDELTQAIPPAYTEWIGRLMLAVLEPVP
jgi:DNA (cytosine-5)-methyltransferase 1